MDFEVMPSRTTIAVDISFACIVAGMIGVAVENGTCRGMKRNRVITIDGGREEGENCDAEK